MFHRSGDATLGGSASMRSVRTLIACVAAVGCALAAAPAVHAVVPPRDCGRMAIEGKRYQVKVDQITCADGKRYARAYLADGTSPRGYTCRSYPTRKGRVKFYCANGRRVFFGIRR
jgi:hypothetical protein